MTMNDEVQLSRALIGGKKIERMEARVSYELKEAARRRWVDAGYSSEAEYLETLVSVDVFGVDHVRSVMLQRLDAVGTVAGKGRPA